MANAVGSRRRPGSTSGIQSWQLLELRIILMGKRRSTSRRKKVARRGSATGLSKPGGTKKRRASETIKHLLQQATVHHTAGRHAEARRLYAEILTLEPAHAHAHYGLGQCVSRLGNLREGLRFAELAVQLQPNRSQYHVSLADLYFTAVELDNAFSSAQRALDLDPQSIGSHCILANIFERRQEFDRGIVQLRRAEQVAPGDVFVQTLLARLERRNKDYSSAHDRIQKILALTPIDPELRRRALFEQATVLDKIGQFPEAYEAISTYGELTQSTPSARRLNPKARPARIASYRAGISKEIFERWSGDDFDDGRLAPAFLVGFPRSGTTMTEQILAAHPQIITADERPYINNMRRGWVRQVGGSHDVGGMYERLTLDGVRELRRRYWEEVDEEFGGRLAGKVFLDKFPLNLIDLGLINVVFPDAKIIVALRDPRDVCLSCLMQDFALNNAMIHFLSLEDTARFYAQVMDLYLALRPALTVALVEVRYEDLVSDLSSEARRMLTLLNLEWDAAILEFHTKVKGRIISTPSFEAVAQPINRGAIGRWRNYREFFGPILPMLERFSREFGYS